MSFAAPVQAQDVELVGNLTQTTGTPYVVNSREYAMPFATGTNSGGYNLTSVDLDVKIVPSSITNLEVQIWSSQTDAMNNVSPNAEVHTLTNPASLSIGANTFAAPSNTVLAADTTYYLLVRNETSDQPVLQWSGNTATGQTGLTGWSIGEGVRRNVGSTNAWATYATPHRRFKLTGSAVGGSNTAPTASNGSVATATNTAYTFDAGDFNFADTDSGDTLEKVKIVTLPDAGTLALSGTAVTVNQEVTKADIDADNLTFTPVTDATGSPYTTFTFKVNDGDDESASDYTMTVNVNMNVMPLPAANVLVSNLDFGAATTTPASITRMRDIAQGFTTGDNTAGYTLETIEMFFHGDFTETDIDDLTATVREVDGDDNPGTIVATLSNPMSITGEGTAANLNADDAAFFTAPDGTTLAAGTDYFVVLGFDQSRTVWGIEGNGEVEKADGWSIADGSINSTSDWGGSSDSSYYIRINGAAVTSTISTDATLSALTLMEGTGTDAVTLTPTFASDTIAYRAWVENGVSSVTLAATKNHTGATVAITDDTDTATPNTATLALAEGANTLTVTVTAEDGTTTKTYTITAVREASAPDADPTARMTAKLTVAQDGTSDIYGYQRVGGTFGALTDNDFEFDGATYTITNLFYNGPNGESSFGLNSIILCFSSLPSNAIFHKFTLRVDSDDFPLDGETVIGVTNCVALSTTTPWAHGDVQTIKIFGNQDATGAPGVSGTAQVGRTLTASTDDIADLDGKTKADAGETGFAYTYQWIRVDADGSSNAADITGATSATYVPVAADVGKKVMAKVNFKDDAGYAEELTSAAYPTSGTISAAASCAAPTYTGDLRQIWTGALTVGSFDVSGETFYGYNSATDPDTGTLSDTTFMVGTTEYTVESVSVGSGSMFGELLAFKFTTAPATSVVNKLVLYVCDDGFAMRGFAPGGTGGYTRVNTGLDWSSETPLNLYMAIDDTAPELQTAEVAGSTLVLTYDEALDEDNDVPASAFAVTVAGGTAAAPSSVAVAGADATVTLTLASPVTVGQTVTLTYTKEAGVPRVRDVFTNEAAALTDRAVVNNSGNTAPPAAYVLISNLNIGMATSSTQSLNSTTDIAQGFTTGGNTAGYTLESIEMFLDASISSTDIGDLTATVREADGDGDPGTTVATLSNPASITGESDDFNLDADDAAVFTAPDGTTLAAGTVYFVVLDFDQSRSIWGATDNRENPGGAVGWSIADNSNSISGSEWRRSSGNSYYIRVNGAAKTAPTNTAPTAANGAVTTAESTPYAFDAGDFNFADTDSGDTLEKVKIVTLPDAGTLALSGTAVTVNQQVTKTDIDDDNLTFTPVVGANGSPYTTFTFKVNDGDDESASAYTMTVNVTAPSADLLWSATMTVGKSSNVSANGYFVEGGLVDDGDFPYGALSDDDFSYGTPAVEYDVNSIRWGTDGSGSLFFVPDAALPAAAKSSLILQIGTNSFPLADAAVSNERRYKWTGAYQATRPPPPKPNSMVSVCLRTSTQVCSGANVPDTTVPEFTSATVNGAFVEMTYSEVLDDTFATQPAADAFTVMVAGSPRTVTDAGVANRLVSGVTKATVRLKLASTVAVGEAVTVAYTKPAMNPVQDVGGNAVVSLAAQSVNNETVAADFVCGMPNLEGRTQIWTGTVTVESGTSTLIQGFEEISDLGALSDKMFTVGSNNYTIKGVTSLIGAFYLDLTSDLSLAEKNALTLHVCDDRSLELGEANGFSSIRWKSDIDWTPFTTRNLALSIAANATGAPTISGVAQVGATLTASTAGIADDEGKTKADNGDAGYAYTYQWVRENADGTSPVDISGATSSTYPVVAADVGKKLKVKVSFTDDDDNAEGPLTSDVTGVVIAAAATTVTIAADEPVIVNALSDMDFTLTRTGDTSAALTVTVTLKQTKQFLSDSRLSGPWTVDFDANATTADFRIRVGQFRAAVTESGKLTATIAPGTDHGIGTPGAATVAVKAAHPAMTARIEQAAYEVPEDVADGTATVHVVAQMAAGFPAPNRTLQYTLVTGGDQAVSPGDFVAVSQSVSFGPDDWEEVAGRFEARKAVELTIVNDGLVELDESLNLILDRTAGLPVDVAGRTLPNGDACPAAGCISTLTILNDDVLPVLDTATVNGLTLVLTYDRELDGDSDPAASAYSVAVAGMAVTPTAVNADGATVTLTLATAVTSGQAVTLDYTAPTMDPVTDSHGNLAPALDDQPVHNVAGDTTAPALLNAQVDGAVLVLTYNEALDPGSEPAVGAFNVQVTPTGGTASRRNVSTVDVSGSKVTLTLASAVLLSDSVAMAYVVPSSNPLQDVAGNDAAAFSGQTVGNAGNSLPIFPDATLTRELTENTAPDVNVGAPIAAATDPDGHTLTYTLEGTDAASFEFDAATRQISTKTGVTYDYEVTTSYEVTVRAADDFGGEDTVTVTIDVKNLPGFSIAPLQERILLSDGRVRFELTADEEPSVEITVLNYTATQDEAWLAAEALQGTLVHITEEAMNFSGPDFKRDAPARSGNVTFTLQPGDGYELGATTSATVAIVAADPLITVRATQAAYSVSEDHGTLAVTLIAETIVGAPMPIVSTARIAWAAVADEATGGGADFRDAGANSLIFHSDNFSEEGGRWVLEREVEVTVVEDNDWELDEEFHIALSRFVEEPPFAPYMHPLVKLANFDGTLCVDLDADEICGATVTILSSDNAAPAFSNSSETREVEENSPADTDVGAPVTATDANTGAGDALTYTLEDKDDAASFAIDPATGQITTITGVDYDFETDPSYAVTVKATDRQNASATVAVTINLTDIDPEGPVCMAPDLSDREQVWMAEMTVGSSTVVPGPLTLYGFDGGSNSYGSLSDDDFRIGTATYDVSALNLWVVIDGELTFNVESLPDRGAVLHICDGSFTLADAMRERSGGRDEYTWTNTDLDWSAVETRNVYLSLTPLPPPELDLGSLTVDGTDVVLTFDADLDESSIPPSDNFEVLVTPEGGEATPRRVRGVRVRGRAVTLELESAVMPGDEVSVEYLGPDGEADAALKGADGVTVPPFGESRQLRNETVDTVAPVLQSQSVSAATLVLRYDEALDESSKPAPDAYDVQVALPGETAQRRDVEAVTISGDTVTLTLESRVRPNETVTLKYTVPAANPVQDLSGNDAPAIDPALEVANETGGNRAPRFLGVSWNPPPSFHITREVPENSGGGVKVGEPIHAEDPDGDRLSWKITRFQRTITSPDSDPNTGSNVISTEWLEWGASAYFTIDKATGQIRTKSDVDYDYEERRSYFIEVEVADSLGAFTRTDVLIELTDEGEPEDSPLLAPEELTLRKLGPTAVALSWQSPRSSATVDKHQFRLGRHPTSVDSVLGGIGPQNPANRVFKDDGWMDFPADAAGPLGHVLRDEVDGQPLIHVWELKAQVRSVTAAGEVSQASNVAFMPDTAPTMVRVGVVSDPASDERGYDLGETIAVELELDEPVRVRGRPLLNLQVAGTTYEARYAGLSHPFREAEVGWGANEGTILRFEYELVSADGQIGAGDIQIDSQVILNGATVTDATRVGNGLPALLSWASAGVTPVPTSRQVALPEFSVADTAATEGPDAHMSFTVTLSAASLSSVTVDYATADGSATAGSDYTASSGALTFPAGETEKTVTVEVLQDNDAEADETLTLTLSNAFRANLVQDEATGTIVDGEPPVDPNAGPSMLSISDARAKEGEDTTMSFTVTLHPASGNRVRVGYLTYGGTATAGTDYTSVAGDLHFAPGETSKTISVAISDDSHDDNGEYFHILLYGAEGGAGIDDEEGRGTILNTDPMPQAWLARFGRAASDHAIQAIERRWQSGQGQQGRQPESHLTIGGRRLDNLLQPWLPAARPAALQAGTDSPVGATHASPDKEDGTDTTPAPDSAAESSVEATHSAAESSVGAPHASPDKEDGTETTPTPDSAAESSAGASQFDAGSLLRTDLLFTDERERLDQLRAQAAQWRRKTATSGQMPGGNGRSGGSANGSAGGGGRDAGVHAGSGGMSTGSSGMGASGMSASGTGSSGMGASGSRGYANHGAMGRDPASAGESLFSELLLSGLRNAGGAPAPKLRDLAMGSSFFYSRPADPENSDPGWLGQWAAWGETAATRFSGVDGKLSLDGEVTTATMGMDSRRGRWLAGVSLSLSEGAGVYRHPSAAGGLVSSTLTSINPYAHYTVNDRTSVWAVLGYGAGNLTLTPESGAGRRGLQAPCTGSACVAPGIPARAIGSGSGAGPGPGSLLETDLATAMAAIGGRSLLHLQSSRLGSFQLALVSDARVTGAASRAIEGLVGVRGDTSRVRLLLEGAGAMPLGRFGTLSPSLEAGLRHDGGDAETGAGFELGGGLGYAVGQLQVQLNGRTLLAHEDAGYEEWGVSGSIQYQSGGGNGQGLLLRLGSAWGADQSGVQSMWSREESARGLARGGPMSQGQRYQAEFGYGIKAPYRERLWYPYLNVESSGANDQALRFGLKLTSGANLEAGLELGRRLGQPGEKPANAIMLQGTLRW